MAKVLGADEDESAFRNKPGVITRQKPKDELKKEGGRGPRGPVLATD
jgi:hypothetical protein